MARRTPRRNGRGPGASDRDLELQAADGADQRLGAGREDFIIETLLSVKAKLAATHENSIVR